MKRIQSNVFAIPIRVLINTKNCKRDQWGKIIDARTGQTLHVGQVPYIRRVARTKYNTILK